MATGSGQFPAMHAVSGFKLGTTSAGIKTAGRADVVVMELAAGSTVAGLFTQNAFCAAPVIVAKEHLASASPRYFLTNTGNANAGTGQQGLSDALQSCETLSAVADVNVTQVLPFSTGVIGEPLPMDALLPAIPSALDNLSEQGWAEAATGILTTDTRPKGASLTYTVGDAEITITGICKGSGMIKPNMATMLGYVATDASVDPELLHRALRLANEKSFNRITVDSDTSTNDAIMLVATGCSGVVIDESLFEQFVDSAENNAEALAVAYTIAESPLVKTALTASDPNWGRILAAIGRAGIAGLDVNRVQLQLNGVLIAEQGSRAASYNEELGQQAMAPEDIEIQVSLHRGQASETVWTTDLSYDYVRINAEYRT